MSGCCRQELWASPQCCRAGWTRRQAALGRGLLLLGCLSVSSTSRLVSGGSSHFSEQQRSSSCLQLPARAR